MGSYKVIYTNKKGEEVVREYEQKPKRVPHMKIFEVQSEKILPLDKIIAYLEKKGIKSETPRITFLNHYRKLDALEKGVTTRELGVELPERSRQNETKSVRIK